MKNDLRSLDAAMLMAGMLLFGSELTMLRSAHESGGLTAPSDASSGWSVAAHLCRLGLMVRNGSELTVTDNGLKALRLTASTIDGDAAFISARLWAIA